VTAAGAAGLGAKVALVERNLMGGDCLNVGCVPSKAVIRASRAAADLRSARELGFGVPDGVGADFAAAMARMRRIRARISRHDSAARFRDELGVDVFLGDARFSGTDTVAVAGKTLRFKRAVIATGARAAHPEIPGLREAGFLTNETVFTLTELPPRLAVIGGGPIGSELAQAFRRFGSEVFLFEETGHILQREDPDAAGIVQRSFVQDGVQLLLESRITAVTTRGREKAITYTAGGATREVVVDEILVGAGRIPNVEGLGLESVGVAFGPREGVQVDDTLRTTNPRIYAAGDVCMRWKFTHAADFAARIVIQNALFGGLTPRKKLSELVMPWCTYTDPEIAHVGLYEQEARAQGLEVATFTVPLSEVDRAITDGEEEGFVKIHVRKGSDRILGATVVAKHAGDILSELTLAIVAKVGLGTIASVIHPYPTQAEAIRKAGDLFNRTRLTPLVKRLFSTWLRLTR
jgi:pyruvate/2-oxoglutarate dehydrogenase complex dihydrolipoamide dehydrogenase (E3) component